MRNRLGLLHLVTLGAGPGGRGGADRGGWARGGARREGRDAELRLCSNWNHRQQKKLTDLAGPVSTGCNGNQPAPEEEPGIEDSIVGFQK